MAQRAKVADKFPKICRRGHAAGEWEWPRRLGIAVKFFIRSGLRRRICVQHNSGQFFSLGFSKAPEFDILPIEPRFQPYRFAATIPRIFIAHDNRATLAGVKIART